MHPFGYAKEIYFWAFVVAILIFAVGAGISVYEGVHKIQHPVAMTNVYVNYIVLGFAVVFEASAWLIAWKEFNTTRGERGILQALGEAKDPSVPTVLLEDTAALLGLIAALLGIFLGQLLGLPILDGVASVVIGVILAVAAAVLAYETKALLIGEAASPEVIARIRRIVSAQKTVQRTNEILTMHLGPTDGLVNLSIDFRDGLDSATIEEAISRMEREIKQACPEVSRVFIEAQSWRGHQLSQNNHSNSIH